MDDWLRLSLPGNRAERLFCQMERVSERLSQNSKEKSVSMIYREGVLEQLRVQVAGLMRMREDAERIHNDAVVADVDSKLAVFRFAIGLVEAAPAARQEVWCP